jgi:ribosomal protein S18 acetylase RimI-like enzyme
MTVTIRSYQENDKEQCRSLWVELVEWHREIYQSSEIGGEHPETHFDKCLSNVKKENLWVASSDSRIVGLTGLIIKENEAEIEPLIVSKAYRHKGIGRKLADTVISEAKKKNIKYLNVSPVARNTQAIKFFYALGFKNLGNVNMFIDFSNQNWKPEIKIHDLSFKY